MEITMDAKTFSKLLEDVALKGKYYDGAAAKNSSLSNYAYVETNEDELRIYNANNTTVCMIKKSIGVTVEDSAVFEISRTSKYLKGFDGVVDIHIGDYIEVTAQASKTKAIMPKVLEHPGMAMISKFKRFINTLNGDEMPIFGKSQYETKITVLSEDLLEATKGCDALNIGKYKFNVVIDDDDEDDSELQMSSERSRTDTYKTCVEVIDIEGEPSTVEFTGHFAHFLNGPVILYLKDEFPIFWRTPNRMMLKAPYLDR